MSSTHGPLHLAFLGCGAITEWHSRYLKSFRGEIALSYASRESAKADAYCRRHGGLGSYASYAAALDDPRVDAVLVAQASTSSSRNPRS
jgi:predicted dehydrogenase